MKRLLHNFAETRPNEWSAVGDSIVSLETWASAEGVNGLHLHYMATDGQSKAFKTKWKQIVAGAAKGHNASLHTARSMNLDYSLFQTNLVLSIDVGIYGRDLVAWLQEHDDSFV